MICIARAFDLCKGAGRAGQTAEMLYRSLLLPFKGWQMYGMKYWRTTASGLAARRRI
tara:strand:+ start:33490 stop:33660 length:171 start_codon:yes stop_codon:yes gene_type:complete